ncbi:MAG: DUF6838 family protein [Lachnospirales bacterium]
MTGLNNIIDGICVKLREGFCQGEYAIYTEEVKQGLKNPCLTVQCVNPMSEQTLGNRYYKESIFVINYFPKDEMAYKSEFNKVSDLLYELLEYIIVKDTDEENVKEHIFRSYDMKVEISDKVLLFFVTYKYFVHRKVENEKMERLEQEVKNGN